MNILGQEQANRRVKEETEDSSYDRQQTNHWSGCKYETAPTQHTVHVLDLDRLVGVRSGQDRAEGDRRRQESAGRARFLVVG